MKKLCILAVLLGIASGNAWADEREAEPGIQLAILLDTSGSMSGLIHQARAELWKVVNELIFSRRQGKLPYLQIALYEYGNSGLSAESGYIRQCVPLTDDLDRVSEELFSLTTNGGDEHCPQVIQVATEDLAWSAREGTLKLIYIAGNETFHQGPVPASDALAAAKARGIVVNTVHCAGGEDTGWREAASLADGEFISIDQNEQVLHIDAPQDEEIAKLGVELNRTYLAYGSQGQQSQLRQQAQDDNGEQAAPGSSVQRAVCKANGLYNNEAWDLCDGLVAGIVDLKDIAEEDLPEEMQAMSPEERQAYVDLKLAERAEIQARINGLNAERVAYVTEKRAELSPENTLGEALIQTVRGQAEARGYSFE